MKIKTKTIIDFSFGNITPEPLNWLKKRYKVHHITRHNLYKHFKKKKKQWNSAVFAFPYTKVTITTFKIKHRLSANCKTVFLSPI